MPPSCITSRGILLLVGAALGFWVPACSGGAGLGESCSSVADCAGSLQCLDHICVPRCTRNSDCGDGHFCADGVCELATQVTDAICEGEYECAPGLSCQLFADDFNHDGFLTASCQPENPGGVLDDTCSGPDQATADAQCRTGTCALGRCVDVCKDDLDCPATHLCTTIPREIVGPADAVASFQGCLPALGDIVFSLPITQVYTHFVLPVPGNARSVALTAEIDDGAQLVGAAYLRSPSGADLYRLPIDRSAYFANEVRSDLAPGAWAMVLPQTPETPLEAGAYVVELGSYRDPNSAGTEVPRVSAIYKLDDAVHLDLHFYFLDLANHPCGAAAGLDAASAQSGPFQTTFLHQLNLIFARAGILVDLQAATYQDILDRPDLDGLDASRLGELLSLSSIDGGVSVFFVRTISPSGVEALVGGPPAPPGRAGTHASGVAVALDTLCYRDWSVVARNTAHEIARSLGLMRSVEPDGFTDPISDSDFSNANLMYFSESGGADLSPDQRETLRRSPALR